jgi:hypothetical protein
MEKPNIKDYEFTYGCIDSVEPPCEACESEHQRYKRDLELWEAQQAKQEDNFWMVAGGPGAPRKRHKSYGLAHDEAKRLAEKQPGTAFYVVRPITQILAAPPQAVSTTFKWDTTK